MAAIPGAGLTEFISIGVVGVDHNFASPELPSVAAAGDGRTRSIDHGGMIEVELGNSARLRVDGRVFAPARQAELTAAEALVQLRTAEIAKLQIVNPAMHMSGSMASIRRSGRSARTGRALPAAAV